MTRSSFLTIVLCLTIIAPQYVAAQTTTSRKLQAPPGVILEQDVSFLSPDRAEKLDLYLPEKRDAGMKSPAIVMIHGGGWVGGNKSAKREFSAGCAFAKAGYVCVSVEYLKTKPKPWPTNLFDCKNAVRWLRANADRLQVDVDCIGVIGGSAGGHLALMVAYTSNVSELQPKEPYPGVRDDVQACVDLYGIANVAKRKAIAKDGTPTSTVRENTALFPVKYKDDPELFKLASPVTHITPQSPPTLILHGTADLTVDRDQSYELATKLKEQGVEHELVMIPGAPHSFTLDDKKLPQDLTPKVIAFFDKHLKRNINMDKQDSR